MTVGKCVKMRSGTPNRTERGTCKSTDSTVTLAQTESSTRSATLPTRLAIIRPWLVSANWVRSWWWCAKLTKAACRFSWWSAVVSRRTAGHWSESASIAAGMNELGSSGRKGFCDVSFWKTKLKPKLITLQFLYISFSYFITGRLLDRNRLHVATSNQWK